MVRSEDCPSWDQFSPEKKKRSVRTGGGEQFRALISQKGCLTLIMRLGFMVATGGGGTNNTSSSSLLASELSHPYS